MREANASHTWRNGRPGHPQICDSGLH
jgi:hypothetical protein